MKLRCFSMLVVHVLLSTVCLAGPVVLGETVTCQFDPAHTGSIKTGSLKPPLQKKWTVDLKGMIFSPLVAGGKVFVAVCDGNPVAGFCIQALDASTGKTVWTSKDTIISGWLALCYDGGRVFPC